MFPKSFELREPLLKKIEYNLINFEEKINFEP